MRYFSSVVAILILVGSLSNALALDETALYNRANCMSALGEFYGSAYVFNSQLTGAGSLSVAEKGDNGSMIVYNKNGQIAVSDAGGCRNQDRTLTASKKIAELLRSANDFIDKTQSALSDSTVGIKSTRPGTPAEVKARAIAENAGRRPMLRNLLQICKAAGDAEISAAVVDAEQITNARWKKTGTAQ